MMVTEMTTPSPSACPCGSGLAYWRCCERYHAGEAAPTPEALMRSRYSAFALDLIDYLQATWHPSTRPEVLMPDTATRWKRLEVLAHDEEGDRGRVHFRATFQEGRCWAVLEENSRFVREQGHWYYLEGVPEVSRLKPGRNTSCPCGSSRKFKSCCGVG